MLNTFIIVSGHTVVYVVDVCLAHIDETPELNFNVHAVFM